MYLSDAISEAMLALFLLCIFSLMAMALLPVSKIASRWFGLLATLVLKVGLDEARAFSKILNCADVPGVD